MKVRNGFVSNSSSSSFVILGIHVDEDTYYNLQEKYENDGILDCYEGWEEGCVVGKYATSYLEKDNIPNAVTKVKEELQSELSKDDFDKVFKNADIKLIYDGYDN